ncbi:HTH-type transcriptional regulator PuuR [bioreactor metagenome]|jgi:transcriptional regulator with XRE-family HTH domain|uniref:XRE family transcriptional regulator n=2 Tax=root TaxID=1 RepID=A0A562JE23_9FIRM|nr:MULTISPECIES: cupin domain-containing protein [Sedimentibacter]MEA5094782.1 helix-turn-helix domain-containing protein [Sedimentibacter saalensis]TWH81407.1 XRE family transcriptional regulator [Sedimentibacter saalensis]
MELGEKIRSLRLKQKISIEQLSGMTGLSKGLISQIERDITGPSVASLWKVSKALNVTMNYFFDEYDDFNQVVRKEERKKLMMGRADRIYELLSPDLKKQIEMLWIEIEPNECNSDELISHDGEECGVVVKGTLRVLSGEKVYDLNEGDSIYLDSTIPHKYLNMGEEESVSVWAMVPPSF